MLKFNSFAIAVFLLFSLHETRAGVDGESIKLAANGQYAALESLMETEEGQHPLGSRDRHALCFAYSKIKRYDRLFPCLDQLTQQVAKGDRRTRIFGLDDATPSIHLMQAEAMLELGRYQEAASKAKSAMDWIAKEGSDDRDFELQALSTMVIASVLSGQRDEAKNTLKKIETMSTAFPLFDDYTPTRVFALARSHVALGNYSEAAALLEGDGYFKLRRFLDNLFSGATLQGLNYWMWADLPRGYLLAKCRLETGRLTEAREALDRLLEIPQSSANGEIYWQMLFDRGRIAEQDGEVDRAIDYYRRAVEIIERQRSSIQTEINKIGFATDKQSVYARLVAVSLHAGREGDALEIVERSKSRALVDLLAGKRAFGSQDSQELAVLSEAESGLQLQQASDAERNQQNRTRWVSARNQLRKKNPELASLVTVSPVSVADVQSRLKPNEVLVEYYISDGNLLAFMADGKKVQAFRLEGRGLEADVKALRKEMMQPDDEGPVRDLAQSLYKRLVAPMQPHVAGKNLLIVPHGILHYLPFSMLHDGKDPLVAHAKLRVLPSSSVLLYLDESGNSTSERSLLIFGNPDLGEARYDLPSAEVEARYIAGKFPGSKLLVRDQATETAFKELAPNYRYLHVASHGQFNPKNPLGSRLLLSKAEKDDGSLTVGELYDLHLKADLVVLSACETGLGGLMGGDDVIGLTRAFIYSGAENIVSSLWEVDDESTAALMENFYKAVAQGMDKAQALRDAQNKLRIKNPHPFFWSAFYLTGSGR